MKTDGRLRLVSESVYTGRSLRMISGPEVVLYNRKPLQLLFPNDPVSASQKSLAM